MHKALISIIFLGLVIVLMLGVAGQAQAAIIVHTSDFIATPSHFNGFEQIPNNGTFFTGGNGPYTEDTIQVDQVNGEGANTIWVTNFHWTGAEGTREWYPNSGDFGYTQISLTGGVDFQDVGFNYGTGFFNPSVLSYELLDNALIVLSGTVASPDCFNCNFPLITYLGFSGGGFDTIRMRDGGPGSVTNGQFQALSLDSIETQDAAVPEPSTLGLIGLGLLGLGAMRRRRRS